jgi:hypothetical protein
MLIVEKVESKSDIYKKLEDSVNNKAPIKLPGQLDRVQYESSLKVAKCSAEQELAYMKFMGIQDEAKEERLKMEARYKREHGQTDDIYFNHRVHKKKGI